VSVLSPDAGDVIAQRILSTAPSNLLAYWPLSEASGTTITDESGNGRTGTYSGVTLGQPGVGDGRSCPYFDGANDSGNVYSAGLASAWSWTAFSVALWVRLNSEDVWTDGSTRKWFSVFTSGNPDFLMLRRTFLDNKVNVWLRMNGNDYSADVGVGAQLGGDWFHVGFSSAVGGNAYRYINGVEATHTTGVAAPNGAAMTSMSISEPAETHHGRLAHVAIWNVQLSAAQMATLAALP
jgi:hypothetical protein